MNDVYDVAKKNNKFIVIKNGNPLNIPKTESSSMVTEFDSAEDAKKYISLIKMLKTQKSYS